MSDQQRNLIFFCYPRTIGQKWRRSVAHLKARWSQFNGAKAVAIAVDETTDSPDDVAAAFDDPAISYHVCRNTELQEIQPFAWLLESAQSQPGITLYAHSKGCTHVTNEASHIWCDAMATACLDFPSLVDCCLRNAITTGAFRSLQPIGSSPSAWHFAGTWYWFRNSALFTRNWGDFEQVFWGTESYPGRHFALNESACLFFDGAHTAHLYSIDWWRAHILPALRGWRGRLSNCGLAPLAADPPNHPIFTEGLQ
jgi:hypothetical protein